MKISGKELSWYLGAIKWPLLLLAAWALAGAVLMRVSLPVYLDVWGNQLVSLLLPALIYFLAGYLATADHGAASGQAAWSGALTGIIIALLGVIILAVNFSTSLELGAQQAVRIAAEQGKPITAADAMPMMRVSLIIGAVFSPLVSGLLGALLGWLGHLLARNVEK